MTDGRRPGGLTALAVLNFVFAAFNALTILGLVFWIVILATGWRPPGADANLDRGVEAMQEIGVVSLSVSTGLLTLVATLEILSGIGYLLQKRVLGRGFGNVYAVLSIVQVASMTFGFRTSEHGSTDLLGTLAFVVYPVLTLILINTTFKEDFVR